MVTAIPFGIWSSHPLVPTLCLARMIALPSFGRRSSISLWEFSQVTYQILTWSSSIQISTISLQDQTISRWGFGPALLGSVSESWSQLMAQYAASSSPRLEITCSQAMIMERLWSSTSSRASLSKLSKLARSRLFGRWMSVGTIRCWPWELRRARLSFTISKRSHNKQERCSKIQMESRHLEAPPILRPPIHRS